jgi:methyl-accepting chemotaxis protein
MYRRVNSGRSIAFATVGIVIVMAVFTWVMYGMAQRVFQMADVMVELNQSFKTMTKMTDDVHTIALTMQDMNQSITEMKTSLVDMRDSVGGMADNVGGMSRNIDHMNTTMVSMTDNIGNMSQTMQVMTVNMNRLTRDIGQASYAFSQPMSYMWGNPFPF